ncbi:hypothetical protein FRC09_008701 [Ceratobasidium sp. 395]|nr:hypothetical protein FRC09_008701 [Ceratobasidium sp. 395]
MSARLPTELLVMIFRLACDDDTTARILATVSRSFYSCSLPFVYRNVAVHDGPGVKLLTENLQREPHLGSLVRHILISEQATSLDCSAFERTLKVLFGLVAPTIRSLTLLIKSRDESVGGVFQTLFDTSFPCLKSLTLCGDHPIPNVLKMPLLQRFHTAGLTRRNAASCFAPLSQSCPDLTHIRVSMSSEHNLTFAISAAFDLPGAPTSLERMCLNPIPAPPEANNESSRAHIPFPSLPCGLVSLMVKPSVPPMAYFVGSTSMVYGQYMKQLEELVPLCPSGKFRLLPAFKRNSWEVESYDVTQAKQDWIDVIRGGMGAWNNPVVERSL